MNYLRHYWRSTLLALLLSFIVIPSSRAQPIFSDGFEFYKVPPTLYGYPKTDGEAAFFLTQATFGSTYESIASLRRLGYQKWLDKQMNAAASLVLPKIDAQIAAGGDLSKIYYGDLYNAWFTHALYSSDQLRQRVAYALSQILVVSSKGDIPVISLASYYDVLTKHAFGNYRDLLDAVTMHPAMGDYLSMRKNRKAGLGRDNANARVDLRDDARPDENYAREIMQLFSVGLVMLNNDGSVKDGNLGLSGIQPISTYDQDTISGFANVFTGWQYGSCKAPQANQWYRPNNGQAPFVSWHWNWCPETDDNANGSKAINLKALRYRLPMKPWGEGSAYPDAYHAHEGTKQLLNYPDVSLVNGILPAGGTARSNMKQALDNVFNHPNVPPFVAFRLIQRLTTSNPSSAYVTRVANVFKNNGSGVRGDLGATVIAILMDPEARDASKAPAHFGKLREPAIRLANLFRALNSQSLLGGFHESWLGNNTHQMVLDAPSVFNYYLPDYQYPGEVKNSNLNSPVLQMMTDSQIVSMASTLSSLSYWNSHLGTPRTDLDNRIMQLSLSAFLPYLENPAGLVEQIDLLFTAGKMPAEEKQNLVNMINQDPYSRHQNDWTRKLRIVNVIWLTINSPTYLVEAH